MAISTVRLGNVFRPRRVMNSLWLHPNFASEALCIDKDQSFTNLFLLNSTGVLGCTVPALLAG